MEIFKFCIRHNIQLVPKWVPREENEIADEISKMVDHDDYMLSPDIFAALDIMWGPHTVDRFSSFSTRQIPRFCSQGLKQLTLSQSHGSQKTTGYFRHHT